MNSVKKSTKSSRRLKMSKIDDLIKEKYPNGVEYRTLGEVCLVGAKDAITK